MARVKTGVTRSSFARPGKTYTIYARSSFSEADPHSLGSASGGAERRNPMNIIEQSYDWAYDPGRRGATTHIVLHHAAGDGTAQAIHSYHKDALGWAGIAYHFYVRKDGSVYRGRPLDWNGGHTSGYNRVAVGVCFEGNYETETMGEAQLAAGRELVRKLRTMYPAAAVVRHRDLNGTACPGGNFPYAQMLEEETSAVDKPSGWAADAAEAALARGIVRGDGAGHYGWQEPVTLEKLAVILNRLGVL